MLKTPNIGVWGMVRQLHVDVSQLTVHQVSDFNEDNWAKGIVQGLGDFALHGRIS